MSPAAQNVWLITGTSTGLGREIVLSALSRGEKVIATARSIDTIQDLQTAYPDSCSVLQLDVTRSFEALCIKAQEAVAVWGRVDVLVNNAGYALAGPLEEAGSDGLLEMYKTNVFGVVNVTNAFLPYMRRQQSGTVVIIGSRSGWRTRLPAGALYGSSKAAIHTIADALAEELRPQGIRVLNVIPGGLRTSSINNLRFVPNTTLAFPAADVPRGEVPVYAEIRSSTRAHLQKTVGKESGDARKAAWVIVDVVRGEGVAKGRTPHTTLYLGSDAKRDVAEKCHEVLANLEEWGDVACSIDVDSEAKETYPNGS